MGKPEYREGKEAGENFKALATALLRSQRKLRLRR
jgi:hypothetical protein